MARKHSPKVIAAIETLAQAGKNAGEILADLESGAVPGLKPLPAAELPPRRTIQHHAARARRELEPVPDLEAFAAALERDIIRVTRREIRRIRAQPTLSLDDARLLREHARTIAQLAAERQRRPVTNPDRVRGGEETQRRRASKPATILEQIGAAIESRERDDDSDDTGHDDDTGSGHDDDDDAAGAAVPRGPA